MSLALLAVLTVAGAGAAWAGVSVAYPQWTRLQAARWEHTVVRDADGVRVAARDFTRGEGEVALLMIHGFASAPPVFQTLADDLAGRGYACRAMRLPGFGEPPARLAATTREDWRAAVDREVDALSAGGRKVWLVGHSMGGTLAIDYALRHPEAPIEGLVLIAPLIDVSSRRSLLISPRTLFETWRHLWTPGTLLKTAFPIDIQAPTPGLEELRDVYMPLSAYAEMFRVTDAVAGRAGELRVPALMMVAPADKVVDSDAARRYYEALGSSRKQCVVMERSGHVVPLDRERDRAAAEIARFIAGRADSKG